MACYHMNVALIQKGALIKKDNNIGDFTHRIIFANSPEFKGYEYYIKANKTLEERKTGSKYIFIPCGKCIGCRIQERKNWALRIELESEKYENNYFLTLTYNDDHLYIPETWTNKRTGEIIQNDGTWTGTLIKKDLQQFIKSLRTYFKREFDHDGMKFYAVGEYGDKTKRPHYHIILMNCPKIDLQPIGNYNRITKDAYFTNERITKIWGKGFIQIGQVTWDSISYTVGYCMKKLFGEIKEDYYAKRGQEPIFAQMSRRPGIGREYFNKNLWNIYEVDEIINSKGQSLKPPRYFDKLMEKEFPEYTKEKKFVRNLISENETKKKLALTGKTLKEQMEIEERTALERQSHFSRERIK